MLAWFGTGWVAGCLLTHQLAVLPNVYVCLAAGLCLLVPSALLRRCATCVGWTSLISGVLLGVTWATWSATIRLEDTLDPKLEGYVTRVTFIVTSIARIDAQGQQFEAEPFGTSPSGVPRHLSIYWRGAVTSPGSNQSTDIVMPGQIWRAALVLKRPRSRMNPHGFDAEAHLFARNVRAIGTVRGLPLMMGDAPWMTAQVAVQRARHHVREGMQRVIGQKRYGPVMIALAMGDQNGVRADDWSLFNLAGMTHLVSISGSHVTLIAALIARLSFSWWKRASWGGVAWASCIPAKTVAGGVAIVTAFLYCLLAGWGVPAQRTFFMLLVTWLAWMSRMRLTAHQVLAPAGLVVCLLDPWAVMATGFWLSFGAVWVLWMASQSTGCSRPGKTSRWRQRLALVTSAVRLQWIISLALVPVLCWLFQQVSLASPLANAIAIPVVTMMVTPLSIVVAGLSLINGLDWLTRMIAHVAHAAFDVMMVPVEKMATASWAVIDIPAFPATWLALGIAGLCWSLQPRGLPARWAGWLWMASALCWTPSRPRDGDWALLALDVGQASSVLLITARHALLFDAGGQSATSNDGQRVVVPTLRALGIKTLSGVFISHLDRDHVGGLTSVLERVPIDMLVGAPVKEGTLSGTSTINPAQHLACHRGLQWERDGVRIEALHPFAANGSNRESIKRNAQSCVIRVTGKHHAALLPGDIGVAEEARLLAAGMQHADVVLAPHHGSATSSSEEWVKTLKASHVIVQAGWMNRFGHPHHQVLNRWCESGAQAWVTSRHGAVWAHSKQGDLRLTSSRASLRRYWHIED